MTTIIKVMLRQLGKYQNIVCKLLPKPLSINFWLKRKSIPYGLLQPYVKHQQNCIHSLRRKLKKKPTNTLKQKLQSEEDSLQVLMEEAKSNYESKLIDTFASYNNNPIFKYISSLTKNSSFPQQMY